jgi:predicted methyltransferase
MSVVGVLSPRASLSIAPLSADMAISLDNVAEWERGLGALSHLRALHRALRKGGILGIVEKRAAEGSSFRRMMQERAVTEDHVTALAEVAGFVLVSRSTVAGQGNGTLMMLKFVKR